MLVITNFIKNKFMKILLIILSILLTLLACENSERNEYINDNILFKSGGTSAYNGKMINYNLVTLDRGKNWYLINVNNKIKETTIIGNVENTYPGLVEHLIKQDSIINSLLERQEE